VGTAGLFPARVAARRAGVTPVILSDSVEGEARDVGSVLAAVSRQVRRYGQPASPPCVLLTGGETTVTVSGTGAGGPNAEFLLSLAIALDGEPGIYALAADTDGVDGMSEVAGADPAASLAANDAHEFFAQVGDQLVTGPTLTNVNDFRAIFDHRRTRLSVQAGIGCPRPDRQHHRHLPGGTE
jgi:hydroxypyruvate reductase